MRDHRWFINRFAILLFLGHIHGRAGSAAAIDAEPTYKGRSFSEWLAELNPCSSFMMDDPNVVAIRTMDTNAVRVLLKWIAEPESKNASCNHPSHSQRAVVGFLLLGDLARPAIPKLKALALSGSRFHKPDRYIQALAYIGPDSVPSFIEILRRGNSEQRTAAISWLAAFHANAVPALPAAVACLKDGRSGDYVVDQLSRLDVPTSSMISALIKAFPDSSPRSKMRMLKCASWIHSVEPKTIAPLIELGLADPKTEVRESARKALRQIEWQRRYGSTTAAQMNH